MARPPKYNYNDLLVSVKNYYNDTKNCDPKQYNKSKYFPRHNHYFHGPWSQVLRDAGIVVRISHSKEFGYSIEEIVPLLCSKINFYQLSPQNYNAIRKFFNDASMEDLILLKNALSSSPSYRYQDHGKWSDIIKNKEQPRQR